MIAVRRNSRSENKGEDSHDEAIEHSYSVSCIQAKVSHAAPYTGLSRPPIAIILPYLATRQGECACLVAVRLYNYDECGVSKLSNLTQL